MLREAGLSVDSSRTDYNTLTGLFQRTIGTVKENYKKLFKIEKVETAV